MGKRVKKDRVKRSAPNKISAKARPSTSKAVTLPGESLESLMHQKEEIEALLSSLEDAYTEAAILEEDYNDIKGKNEKKLEEINKKIDTLMKGQAETGAARPLPVRAEAPVRLPRMPISIPAIEEEEFAPAEKPEEKPKKEKKAKEEKAIAGISHDDLENLQLELAEKIKEMVEEIGAKVTEKDLLEMKNNFAKYEAEIDKMKAQVEAVRESRRVDDEKIQRLIEGIAEIRTMVYGREASSKEQEIKIQKAMDVVGKLEPERILLEVGRRDKEINNLGLKVSKLDEMTKEFGEMLKKIETLLRNIGSLEHVINISNEAAETLMEMQNIQRSDQKMLDKIQGIYAELSKRMEEFMLYRAKQDRMEDLINEALKSLDDISTKAAYFVTKDDLEAFRATVQAAPSPSASAIETYGLETQKEEIEMLLKTLYEEFRNRVISKEEYEKMKKANMAKLKEIEDKMKAPAPAAAKIAAEEPRPQPKPQKKEAKEKRPETAKVTKSRTGALLRDLEESFKKGFISKEAYDKTKKMILGKK
jgi:hypothetical protein